MSSTTTIPTSRISYPDLIEEDGRYYVTETQKDIARVHELDAQLFEGLWSSFENRDVATAGLVLDLPVDGTMPGEVEMPVLPAFNQRDAGCADSGTLSLRQGFAIGLWLRLDALSPGQIMLDNRTEDGHGLCLQTAVRGTLEIVLDDGRTQNRWSCDPGLLRGSELHHVVVIVDGGPRIITFIVDGRLCDGGDHRQFGWGRFSLHLRDVRGGDFLRIAPQLRGLRVYDRYLLTSEAIGNFRAGCA